MSRRLSQSMKRRQSRLDSQIIPTPGGKKSQFQFNGLNSLTKKRSKLQHQRTKSDALLTENDTSETKESERTKMNKKFQLLYIPPTYLKKTLNEKSGEKFTRFSSLDGNIDFISEKNNTCPSNTIKGLKRRLKYNKSAKNLYIEHYNKQQKKAINGAIGQLNTWKTRIKKMPKVLIRPKHHSMIAGSILEPVQDSIKGNFDDSSLDQGSLVFNKKMFFLPKKERKVTYNEKEEDKSSLIYKKKNYSKKIRLRNMLKKTGKQSNVVEMVKKEENEDRESRLKKLREYCFAWYKPSQLNPVLSREGASFNYFDGKGWLIGGIGEKILEDVFSYDPSTQEFTKIEGVKPDIGVPRFNHTSIVYKSKFYIFGGEIFNNHDHKSRRVLNDIKIFDPVKRSWMGINASGEFINPRRNHVACKAGRLMFVNGGLSQNGEVLNDTWTFNFESKTWSFVYLYKQIPSLSHHAACAVFNNPDKIVDIGHGNLEGIYIFGGKGADRKPSNKLFVINVFNKPPTLIEPHTVGMTPYPRFGHSMHYYSQKKLLIVYGGRNDEMFQISGKCNFDDLFVLNLKYMGWCKVRTGIITPGGRYYFSSFLKGLRDCNYVSGITYCLELDEILSYKLIEQQKGDKILDDLDDIQPKFEPRDDDIISLIEKKASPKRTKLISPEIGYFNHEEEQEEIMRRIGEEDIQLKGVKSSIALLEILRSTTNLKSEDEEQEFGQFVSYLPLPNAFSLGNTRNKGGNKEEERNLELED